MKRFLLLFSSLFILTSYFVPDSYRDRTSTLENKHKILIVPFEPKLYMSQVDHKFNAATKLSQKQIKEIFRRGINKELESALKKQFEVLDLLKDTAKYKKDLISIYKNLTYSFDKVPDQSHYKAPGPEKEKKDNIKKGQLVVETDPNARFMNAKITNPGMVPGLYAKYKTDLFLFVNQLDIISNNLGTGETGTITERILTIHYTVYTVDAKEIQSGICSLKFPADADVPSKVVSSFISKMAAEIARRINMAVAKADAEKKK